MHSAFAAPFELGQVSFLLARSISVTHLFQQARRGPARQLCLNRGSEPRTVGWFALVDGRSERPPQLRHHVAHCCLRPLCPVGSRILRWSLQDSASPVVYLQHELVLGRRRVGERPVARRVEEGSVSSPCPAVSVARSPSRPLQRAVGVAIDQVPRPQLCVQLLLSRSGFSKPPPRVRGALGRVLVSSLASNPACVTLPAQV